MATVVAHGPPPPPFDCSTGRPVECGFSGGFRNHAWHSIVCNRHYSPTPPPPIAPLGWKCCAVLFVGANVSVRTLWRNVCMSPKMSRVEVVVVGSESSVAVMRVLHQRYYCRMNSSAGQWPKLNAYEPSSFHLEISMQNRCIVCGHFGGKAFVTNERVIGEIWF